MRGPRLFRSILQGVLVFVLHETQKNSKPGKRENKTKVRPIVTDRYGYFQPMEMI